MGSRGESARETYRLAVVPYLNVQPLIAHLSSSVDRVEICAEVPSKLGPWLESGAVDVAIVPAFALLSHPEWRMVPGVGIACDGPVESVVLVSASPLEEIERVVLDPASRSSAALTRILFRHHWKRDVEFVEVSRTKVRPEEGTAHLVIGDPALRARRRFAHVIDLGAAWKAMTGLPFVFAVWAVRPGVDLGPLASRLSQAPELIDTELLQRLADEQHRELKISRDEALIYLRDRLRFRLGREEMLGLRQFLDACVGLGLGAIEPVRLNILPRSRSAEGTG